MGGMRIVSLLPSATEIVYALDLGDALEAVTFECDYPPAARTKPVVSTTALPADGELTAREIDTAVSESVARGEPLYRLDTDRIAAIAPDLILTQDLCRVCAVPAGDVEAALGVIGCQAAVVSLDPSTLDDVIACVGIVGDATGTAPRAHALMRQLRDRVAAVRRATRGRGRPRTFALEWSDPPFSAGHWVAEMIDAAGGEALLTEPGERSRRLDWAEVAGAAPEAVVFMPCGYGLDAAVFEARSLLDVPALAGVHRMVAVDADGYFSRPGPRLVDGIEALAHALHPDAVPAPPPGILMNVARARPGARRERSR
jgi:iron complex transport system substrate-binding protein